MGSPSLHPKYNNKFYTSFHTMLADHLIGRCVRIVLVFRNAWLCVEKAVVFDEAIVSIDLIDRKPSVTIKISK